MARIVLEDGRWFDSSKAEKFNEDTEWDGNNMRSCATGSPHNHERLYRTAGGKWILHGWSQWQGSMEWHREIDNDEAARWLVKNGHDDHEACEAEIAALEVT